MDHTLKGPGKQFNKRAYLKQKLKKNYGNQQEGHGRAFIQKKAVVRQYFRQQRREEERHRKKILHQQLSGKGDEEGRLEIPSRNNTLIEKDTDKDEPHSLQGSRKKLNSWQRAKEEYRRKVVEKEQNKEEAVRKKKEIEEAKQKYKEKRLHRYKKLNQKTKKGQPVMSSRIELMLEKLQEEIKS